MDQPAAPNITPPPPPPAPPSQVITSTPSSSKPRWVILAVMFIVGILVGFGLFKLLVKPQATMVKQSDNGEISLPADAVVIQACSDHRGKLYVKPSDIPVGPVYMVNNGKVIGVEFMLAKDDFLSGKSFKYLAGLGIKVDHVNIGLLSQGHEGYPVPHYHVDVYAISKAEEDAIICPGSSTSTATPSATLSPTASSSATPSAAMP